jgi:hypothetical protein
MSEDGEGGGQEVEAPGLNNLWGTAGEAGAANDHKGQADAYQTAIHDAPDAFNGMNKMFGWSSGMKAANQAEHLATNAWDMGNVGMAQKFANYADESREAGMFGKLNGLMESKAMGVGGNALGGVLGGLNVAKGIGEWSHGDKTQGGMDIAAGGLGVGASALGAASSMGLLASGGALAAAAPIAAPVAVVAGLAAAGNDWTKHNDIFGGLFGSKKGTWGENADGSARDSLQFVGQTTAGAYHGVDNAVEGALGDHWYSKAAGKTLGGIAGAGTAIGTGAAALVTDVAGGVAATGQGLWNGAKWAGNGIASGAKALGSGISNVASSVGSGIGSAAKSVGSGISSAAHSVGNFVSHLW